MIFCSSQARGQLNDAPCLADTPGVGYQSADRSLRRQATLLGAISQASSVGMASCLGNDRKQMLASNAVINTNPPAVKNTPCGVVQRLTKITSNGPSTPPNAKNDSLIPRMRPRCCSPVMSKIKSIASRRNQSHAQSCQHGAAYNEWKRSQKGERRVQQQGQQ